MEKKYFEVLRTAIQRRFERLNELSFPHFAIQDAATPSS